MKNKFPLPLPFPLLNTQLLGSNYLCNGIPQAATVFTLAIPYSNTGRIEQYNDTDSSQEMAVSHPVNE